MVSKVKMAESMGLDPDSSFCDGCPGHCCSLFPELTVYDVFRLALSQKRELPEFLLLHYAQDDDAYPISISGKMVKMTLERGGNKCIFFDKGAPLKCSVQDAKPGICLAFPYMYLDGSALDTDKVPCPAPNAARFRWTEAQKAILADAKWELDRHSEIISDWNSSARERKDLAEFLRFAAREIEYEKTPLGSLTRKIRRAFRKR
jgi:hypothetical protein